MPTDHLRSAVVAIDEPGARFTVTAPVPGHAGWLFDATYSRAGSGWGLERVAVRPAAERSGHVTSVMLRALPLAGLPGLLARYRVGAAREPLLPRLTKGTLREFRARGSRSDRDFARLADAYLRLCATSRRPIVDLAAVEGFASTTVRDWLREARSRGLLVSAGPGRVGGQLTERARALLDRPTP